MPKQRRDVCGLVSILEQSLDEEWGVGGGLNSWRSLIRRRTGFLMDPQFGGVGGEKDQGSLPGLKFGHRGAGGAILHAGEFRSRDSLTGRCF